MRYNADLMLSWGNLRYNADLMLSWAKLGLKRLMQEGGVPCLLSSGFKALVWHDERMAEQVSRDPLHDERVAEDVSRDPP